MGNIATNFKRLEEEFGKENSIIPSEVKNEASQAYNITMASMVAVLIYQSLTLKKLKSTPNALPPSKVTIAIPTIASIAGGYVIYHYYNKLASYLPPVDVPVPQVVANENTPSKSTQDTPPEKEEN